MGKGSNACYTVAGCLNFAELKVTIVSEPFSVRRNRGHFCIGMCMLPTRWCHQIKRAPKGSATSVRVRVFPMTVHLIRCDQRVGSTHIPIQNCPRFRPASNTSPAMTRSFFCCSSHPCREKTIPSRDEMSNKRRSVVFGKHSVGG